MRIASTATDRDAACQPAPTGCAGYVADLWSRAEHGPKLERDLGEQARTTLNVTLLIACNEFWDDEILDDWIQDIRNERVPDFDDGVVLVRL